MNEYIAAKLTSKNHSEACAEADEIIAESEDRINGMEILIPLHGFLTIRIRLSGTAFFISLLQMHSGMTKTG